MQAREQYGVTGPDELGDIELIALVLGTGAGGRTVRAIATELVERHGTVKAMASASAGALAAVRGVGPARAVRLHAGLTLGLRAARQLPSLEEPVRDAAGAARWFVPALGDRVTEELHALFLDRRNRPLAYRHLTRGSDRFTVVDPRQVMRIAVELGAHAVLVAHNHPSGDPEPSAEDLAVTRRLKQAGEVLGVNVLDHLVIGGTRWVSLAERGV